MHYVTLEHVDEYLAQKAQHKKHFFWHLFKEVFQFGAIFVAVFLLSTIIVNANLFYHTMKNVFSPVVASDVAGSLSALTDHIQDGNESTEDQSRFLEQQIQESMKTNAVLPDHSETMSYYLATKVKGYAFQFNTMPPENRLIIPAIGVNAPIVDVTAATEQKLRKGDFDKELYSGVVKYPSTPEPGAVGNALIFGHSSYYWWKNNPYAEIFAKLPALKEGDLIQSLWHGQLTEFEVVAKIIVAPSGVDEAYMKYTDGNYITLMGCYPIGSDSKRILIIAKKKTTPSGSSITLSPAKK